MIDRIRDDNHDMRDETALDTKQRSKMMNTVPMIAIVIVIVTDDVEDPSEMITPMTMTIKTRPPPDLDP